MKFLSTHFDDYIENSNHNNLHDNIKYQTKDIENLNNLILYGPPGCGKYTQCLRIINNFSLSNLKYEKKLLHVFNKQNFNFKLSDIHIEIDMSLLGCNSKILWNELYNKILDIAFTKQDGYFIIVCLNFHMIHSELLENFYSYMQTFHLNMIKLKFILITEEISFISNNILNKCEIISVPRPTKTKYNKCIKNMNLYTFKECLKNKSLSRVLQNKQFENITISGKTIDLGAKNGKASYYRFLNLEYSEIDYVDINPTESNVLNLNLEENIIFSPEG